MFMHCMFVQRGSRARRGILRGMTRFDLSALTSAQLDTLIASTTTHIQRILDGAQSGTIGDSRSFSMARIPELTDFLSRLSAEKRARGETGGDFIVAQFGEPQGPVDGGL